MAGFRVVHVATDLASRQAGLVFQSLSGIEAPSMSQSSPKSRVSSGIPWWLWLLMVVVSGSVVIGSLLKLVPGDPEKIFQDAMKNASGNELHGLIEQLEKFPDRAGHVQLLKGMEQLALSRPLKAVPHFEKAQESDAVRAKALSSLGVVYMRVNELPKAQQYLLSAVKEDSSDLQARQMLCGLYSETAHLTGLIDQLQEMLDLKLETNPGASLKLRGQTLMLLDRYEEAAADFEAALKVETNSQVISEVTSDLIVCLKATGKPERIPEVVDHIASAAERDALQAEGLLAQGKIDEARAAIEKAIVGSETDLVVQKARGRLVLAQGSDEAARVLGEISQALLNSPRDAELFRILSDIARLAGKDEDASLYEQNLLKLEELRNAYTRQRDLAVQNPLDVQARVLAGDMAAEFGDVKLATRWYNAAQRLEPTLNSVLTPKRQWLYQNVTQLISLDRVSLYEFDKLIQSISDGVRELP